MKRQATRIARAGGLLAAMLVAGAAAAQTAPPVEVRTLFGSRMLWEVVEVLVFGILGIALVIGSYKVFDWAVPWDLEKEIAQDQNTAAAIIVAAMFIGVSIIIAAVLVS